MSKKDGYVILESSYTSTPEIVSDKCDVTIFKAIIQEAELPNRNKRIYSKRALEEAIARPMFQEKLRTKNFFGEAGHPMEESLQRQTYIDQRNISHIITDVSWEGNLLMATIETANTQAGKDFQGLIRQGAKVSFSMRGVGGSVRKKDGYDFIDSGLHILTYDWVVFPSHEKAYMQDIIKEDAEFFVEIDNHMNSEKVLTEGHMIPFDMDELDIVLDEGFTIKNLPNILANMFKGANKTGKYEALRPRLLKMVESCKTPQEITYLERDKNIGITQLRKLIKEKPEQKQAIEEHIKWLNGEYTRAINKKQRELKSVKKEEFSFNESHATFLEIYKEDSLRNMMDDFMKNL